MATGSRRPRRSRRTTGSAPAGARPRACARCCATTRRAASASSRPATRGEGGDRTLVIDAAAEDARLRRARALHDDGARFTAVSEERGVVDFGDPDVLVVIDPIDGSLNAKRGLTHHALSIAVADGPDDGRRRVRLRLRPRARRGVARDARRRARSSTTRCSTRRCPSAARRDGRLEVVAIESADPRWLARVVGRARATSRDRVRAIGSIAISLCQVAAARVDGMAVAVDAAARSTPRPAQLIVRESGGRRRVRRRATTRSPRRCDLEPRSPVVAARTPAALAAAARTLPTAIVIDWDLAERVARRRRRRARRRAATLPGDLDALARGRAQRVVAYTRLTPRDAAAAPEAVGRDAWARRQPAPMRATLEPLVERARRDRRARSPGRCAPRGGMLLARRGRRARRLHRAGACSASTSSRCSTRRQRPRGCCSSRRTSHEAARAHGGRPLDELLRLGHAPRGHARRPVRGGAVAARAPRRAARRAARVAATSSSTRRRCCGCRRSTTLRALSDRSRDGGLVGARHRARAQATARPHAGDDGARRGPRRARHGRRRRAARPVARRAARGAGPPPRRERPPLLRCSSACSAST